MHAAVSTTLPLYRICVDIWQTECLSTVKIIGILKKFSASFDSVSITPSKVSCRINTRIKN